MFCYINRKADGTTNSVLEVYCSPVHPHKFQNAHDFLEDKQTRLVQRVIKANTCKALLDGIEEVCSITSHLYPKAQYVHSPIVMECAIS